jgi:hypothetical protein
MTKEEGLKRSHILTSHFYNDGKECKNSRKLSAIIKNSGLPHFACNDGKQELISIYARIILGVYLQIVE